MQPAYLEIHLDWRLGSKTAAMWCRSFRALYCKKIFSCRPKADSDNHPVTLRGVPRPQLAR